MTRRSSLRLAVPGLAALALGGCIAVTAAPAVSAAPNTSTGSATAASITAPLASLTGARNLISPLNTATGPLDGVLSAGASALASISIDTLGSSVLEAARAALRETAAIIDRTTTPRLESTWFSSVYWRVAALASLLTLPFLFAAAVQALLRSDLALLARASLVYLPLALIGVSVAAPITMLLLSATDEMCSLVAGAGAAGGASFLERTAAAITAVSVLGSPFLGFTIGLLTLAAALALALEMLIREAAVYVVMLMLPLAFAALVWPARRIWAVRTIELLISLILSKFVIVAVLSLAGAAYGSGGSLSVTRELTAMALVMLSTLAPWVMLRLLPFTEVAAGAAGSIRAELPRVGELRRRAAERAEGATDWVEGVSSRMRRHAAAADPSSGADDPPERVDLLNGSGSGRAGSGASAPADSTDRGTPAEPAATTGARATGEPTAERLPGMDPLWQQPDQSWAINLGPGGYGGAAGPLPDDDAASGGSWLPGTVGSSASAGDDPPPVAGGDPPLPAGADRPLLGPGTESEPR